MILHGDYKNGSVQMVQHGDRKKRQGEAACDTQEGFREELRVWDLKGSSWGSIPGSIGVHDAINAKAWVFILNYEKYEWSLCLECWTHVGKQQYILLER